MSKKHKMDSEKNENVEASIENEVTMSNDQVNEENPQLAALNEENEKNKKLLEEKTQKCDEYLSMLQRNAAEFDNYKKRTQKEKEAIYVDASGNAVMAFLPVLDNMERALDAIKGESEEVKILKEGVDMVFKQLKDAFNKLGVEEIVAKGQNFDPEIHNAVMHVEDETVGENQIIEVFQKGYKVKDKVLRHSMVKVAN